MSVRRGFAAVLAAMLVTCLAPARAAAGPIFFASTPYLSFGNSPFSGPGYSMYLETFEDDALNTPGVAASGGSINTNGEFVDSVDAEDGAIDGNGSTQGHSWYSNFVLDSFTFTFDGGALGALPTAAGIVWTDAGYNSETPYFAHVAFEAFGSDGSSIGGVGPYLLGDGTDMGQTAEDRFFGVFDPNGISAITISSTDTRDWEVDDLQYGSLTPVPEPGSLVLLGLGTLAGVVRRRCALGTTRASSHRS
jgi:hypothetical protein